MVRIGIIASIKKASLILEQELTRVLKPYDLTFSQLNILLFLYHNQHEVIRQKDIADALGIRHTSVIDVIKKLKEKGFVVQQRDENDARSVCFFITQKGIDSIDQQKREGAKESMIYDALSESERNQLKELLQKVIDNAHA